MIIVIKKGAEAQDISALNERIASFGLKTRQIEGLSQTVLGVVGDASVIDAEIIRSYPCVASVTRISDGYKLSSRKNKNEDTVINVGGVKFGGNNFAVIAGPCSIESEKQIISIAKEVKSKGANVLRGGAFKPRTSPYSFQGMQCDGLKLLEKAKAETGLPIVSEIMEEKYLPEYENVDIIQVGARNMQNFELLKALGKTDKPILLKRGLSATIDELLMSAEYILKEGNDKVILCERGIRTFERETRNTLDLSVIPLLKEKTHLPVIVDPSHATGMSSLVEPMALASVAAGANGLMIEVHNNPESALCDGAQAVTPDAFGEIIKKAGQIGKIIGKQF